MQAHDTQYDLCQEHVASLTHSLAVLSTALRVYKDSDHPIEVLDSPFLLEMNEELIGINAQVENLIRRISPTYGIDERDLR
jgi:hypothetical protein